MSENGSAKMAIKIINGMHIMLIIVIIIGFITGGNPDERLSIFLIGQAVLLFVCRPLMNSICRMLWLWRLKKKEDKFFLVDRTMETACRVGEVRAARWCAAVLFLFAAFVFLWGRIWRENFRFIDMFAGIVFPFSRASLLLWEASKLAADMPPTKGVKPFRLEYVRNQNDLWIIINHTDLSVSSRRDIYSSYLITKDELYHVLPKGISEREFMAINPRCCYLIQMTTQQDLEKIFDKVYEEYLESSNDGLHKIVILNLRMLTTQERLVIPDKYQRQEFIYYAELKNLGELTYQFLCSVCGDDLGYNSVYNSVYSSDYNSTYNSAYNSVYGLYYFENPNNFRFRIDADSDIRIKNTWLKDFYNSACVFQNPSRAVMALMDYWELLLRLQAIYYYQMAETPSIKEEELVHANFMTLGKFLVEASTFYPEHQQLLKEKEFKVPNVIHEYLDKLKDYIYIHYSGEKVSFLGLISLVQILRNKIVAHGVMNDEIASIVWGLIYWATVLLNHYLLLSNFQLKEAGDTYEIGFNITVQAGKFILACDGYPCIAAIQKSNKKSYIFVNFFNGKLIAPEYVEGNLE